MSVTEPLRTQDQIPGEEMLDYHAGMLEDLDRLSAELLVAAPGSAAAPRRALAHWIQDVLLPHAEEEERTTYRAAAELPEGHGLIESLRAEHGVVRRLVELFTAAPDPEAGAYGRALFEVFRSHQGQENDIVLPLLAGAGLAPHACAG